MTTTLPDRVPETLHRSAVIDLAGGLVLVATATATGWAVLGYPVWVLTQSLALYLLLATVLLRLLRYHMPWRRFGPANRVTLLRAALVTMIAGLLGHAGNDSLHAWAICAIAALALGLDGIDGWLARRSEMISSFGARFDMEVDALLILVLSLLLWQTGKVGAWVLAGGFMRYAFVAAGMFWTVLRAPLFPSRRRQAVCLIQVLALIAAIAPTTGSGEAVILAAAALALLGVSFTCDTLWLVLRRP